MKRIWNTITKVTGTITIIATLTTLTILILDEIAKSKTNYLV